MTPISSHDIPLTSSMLIDISVGISPNMPVFSGDPGVRFTAAVSIDAGDVANVTMVEMGSQTGTHYDAPHHILNDGKTSESIPLSVCYGTARVIEIPESVQAIDAQCLQPYEINGVERLLVKTRNSRFWQESPTQFRTDFAAFTQDGAAYLAQQGIRLIGFDYLSIELYGSHGLGAHKAFLNAGITILEGVNLADVTPGDYVLCAFPLKYLGLDGAPTRAVLLPLS